MTAALNFDSFHVGQALGSSVQVIDRALVEAWHRLYWDTPPGPVGVPLGLLSVKMMRAYMTVVAPRPPGNIHAGQAMRVLRPAYIDEPIAISMTCDKAILKRERRLVRFGTVGTSATRRDTLFEGALTIFWAR